MHKQGVAAGQVDGAHRGFGVGHIAAVDAPMVAVQIGQRQIENHQFLEPRRGHGPQKARNADNSSRSQTSPQRT